MRIAILGLGNVGLNFLRIISENRKHLEKSCGSRIELAYAGDSRNLIDVSSVKIPELIQKKSSGSIDGLGKAVSIDDVIDSGVDAIVDMSSASKDGKRETDIYLKAYDRGISVVTANKSPLALHWKDVVPAAEKKGVRLLYEATVAGGVPIFNFIKYSCGPSTVLGFHGIVSLTANFILKTMGEGTPFEKAVKIAQDMGVAETDYTDDTSGLDGARKSIIVANSVFGKQLSLSDIKYSGIPELSGEDISKNWKRMKFVSDVSVISGKFEIFTGFRVLEDKDYLHTLGETALGYELHTDNNGTLRVASAHDGPRETASAVVNDVLILSRELREKPGE